MARAGVCVVTASFGSSLKSRRARLLRAGYSHPILSATHLGELQVPVGRLLALVGRFGWVRAEPSGDGRFVVWSAGGKSAGSGTAAPDSAAAVERAAEEAVAAGGVERGRKKRKRSAVT